VASITDRRHIPWILLHPHAIHVRYDYHCLFLRKSQIALATVGRTHPMKTMRVGRPRALRHSHLSIICK